MQATPQHKQFRSFHLCSVRIAFSTLYNRHAVLFVLSLIANGIVVVTVVVVVVVAVVTGERRGGTAQASSTQRQSRIHTAGLVVEQSRLWLGVRKHCDTPTRALPQLHGRQDVGQQFLGQAC